MNADQMALAALRRSKGLGILLVATNCLGALAQVVPQAAGTVDAGGQRTASAQYANDGSVGGIGGVATGGSITIRGGYVGQLTELTNVTLTSPSPTVNETATVQLGGSATYDDGTVAPLTGAEVIWSPPAFPLASITSNGLATAAAVYMNTPGTFIGRYLGVEGSGSVLVLDTIPDNYGVYSGDGLPDSWQVQYFGLNNPLAAPGADADGTGQNNLFKYVAGLDPTSPASVFKFSVTSVPGQPGQKQLVFSPCWPDRNYALECRTSLLSGLPWTSLTNTSGTDSGTQRTLTDLGATQPSKFYRIGISYPGGQ